MRRPTLAELWTRLSVLPMGKTLFSVLLGRLAPYTGTISARIIELEPGYSKVIMRDRSAVRNHLNSVHAIALMNLGEVATGIAVMVAIDGQGRGIITQLKMEYVKKARGTITATCHTTLPTTPGKHDLTVEGTLRDEAGDEVARATATWRIDLR